VDPQTLDATHEIFHSFWQERSGSVADASSQRKAQRPTERRRREVGHSSALGRIQRRAAGVGPSPSLNPSLPLPNLSVSSNANAASDAPMSATRSTFSQDQNTITPSDGRSTFYFHPGDHLLSNVAPMNAANFNPQSETFPQAAPLYPLPMSTSTSMFSSRQTGNSGATLYPASAHGMNEMVSYPGLFTAMPLPYPHPPFNSKGIPQAGTSHYISDHFLPPTVQATCTPLIQPQPCHRSTGWRNAAGSSHPRAYPSH
jgi:hypothetical protein